MSRPIAQRATSYALAWHWPTSPREVLGLSHHPNTAIADILMHAERLLNDGFGVTITPPATARHTPVAVEVVDIEVVV